MNATASSSGPEAQAGRPARAQVRSADGLGLVAFRWQGWAAADGGRQAPR
ncbi:alpha/beta hydrolase, partial [Burkholderia sp. Ax-1720]|nr:alpha/beta hydrolase [Burkholderia sp. Ax-1720]